MPLYTECITEAARIIMESLCLATGGKQGDDAYQLDIPAGRFDAWKLTLSGGAQEFIAGCAVTSLILDAPVEGRFFKLEEAQRFAAQVCSVVPLTSGVVEGFFVTAPPTFEVRYEQPANHPERTVRVYYVTVPCRAAITMASG